MRYLALCMTTLVLTACPAGDQAPACERSCGAGLECKRVADPYVEGTFREMCVPVSQGCEPTCGPGSTCESGACVTACDPACPGYKDCQEGVCVPPAGGYGCSQILDCTADCADTACAEECAAEGNAIGANLWSVFDICVEANQCVDAACVDANCVNQYRACLGLPPTCSPACESGFLCDASAQCVPVGGEQCNPPCPTGQSCVDGMCQLGGGCSGNESACIGKILQICQNGSMVQYDCAAVRPDCVCAFVPDQNRHDCACGQGQGSPCNPPCPFPLQCIGGFCE